MDGHRFDDLTRALARGTSRRAILKALGLAVAGGVVPALGPKLAWAQGNRACAQFCAQVFGADTPAAGQCTSEAAQGRGLCYTCGPASAGGTKPICCPQNSSGQCTSYSTATCCTTPAAPTCVNGQCGCGTGPACLAGQVCAHGACARVCTHDADCGGCTCARGVCVQCSPPGQSCNPFAPICPTGMRCVSSCVGSGYVCRQICTEDANCPMGEICAGVCVPVCS
jgi:hypothetical protein